MADKPIDVICKDTTVLHEEVDQWKETAEEMREDYKKTIHSLMSETFKKTWVNVFHQGDAYHRLSC